MRGPRADQPRAPAGPRGGAGAGPAVPRVGCRDTARRCSSRCACSRQPNSISPGMPLLIRLRAVAATARAGRIIHGRHVRGADRCTDGRRHRSVHRAPARRCPLVGWAVPFPDLPAFAAAVRAARLRLAELRRDDAALTLATAHATKGLEFDHVAVIGMEVGRFPSARSIADGADPIRSLEEERRLAYVAWTRARRSLTLVYDPGKPVALPDRGVHGRGTRASTTGRRSDRADRFLYRGHHARDWCPP